MLQIYKPCFYCGRDVFQPCSSFSARGCSRVRPAAAAANDQTADQPLSGHRAISTAASREWGALATLAAKTAPDSKPVS